MTKRNQIVQYLKDNPRATNSQIAHALGMQASTVASQTTQLVQRGVLDRELDGATLSGVRRFGFFVRENVISAESAKKGTTQNSLDALVAKFVDGLAEQLVDAVVTNLKPALESKLKEALPKALPRINPPAPKQEVLPGKRKVLVVGLLPQQAGMISQEFGDVFDMSFADKDAVNGKLRSQVLSAELVIGMTGFISHSQDDILQAAGGNYRKCPGGMTRLRDLLTEEYASA